MLTNWYFKVVGYCSLMNINEQNYYPGRIGAGGLSVWLCPVYMNIVQNQKIVNSNSTVAIYCIVL